MFHDSIIPRGPKVTKRLSQCIKFYNFIVAPFSVVPILHLIQKTLLGMTENACKGIFYNNLFRAKKGKNVSN